DPQRQPYLLPLTLAAAVPHRDAARRVPAGSRQGVPARRLAGRPVLLPLLDHTAASGGIDRALALLRPGPRSRAGGAERRARRAGADALRPRAGVLPHPRRGRLRRFAVLR